MYIFNNSCKIAISQEPRSGVLHIRVCEAKDITLPQGAQVPDSTSVPILQRSKRESFHRKQHWWLPYIVLEFDNNEILIDALGGDTSNPVYNYRASL
jgi:serum/glucocorticoid-regulated kinase 2